MTVKKVIYDFEGNKYYITDLDKDYDLKFGHIQASDLRLAKGDKNKVISNQNKTFFALEADFIDNFEKMKRAPQAINPKDSAVIMAYCSIGSNSVVLDSGTGSGGAACFIARHAKKVVSYDINQENIKVSEKNAETLGLKNIEFKHGDIYEGIKENNFDAAIIDVPEPWKALETLTKSVKVGGFVAVYCPSITQNQQFVNECQDYGFLPLKTIELVEREWNVFEKRARPLSGTIYTGFITIARKITKKKN